MLFMTSYLKAITIDSHRTLQNCVNGVSIQLLKAEDADSGLFQEFF